MKNWKTLLVALTIVLAALIALLVLPELIENRAIDLEENTRVAQHQVAVEEKRRLDLVGNLVDCVKEYDKHEASVLQEIVDRRAGSVDPENASARLVAVAENYPELKSNSNYKELMLELSRTENKIAQVRNAYNTAAAKYKRYIRRFPANWFLGVSGYEVVPFDAITFDVPSDAPQDLFGEE